MQAPLKAAMQQCGHLWKHLFPTNPGCTWPIWHVQTRISRRNIHWHQPDIIVADDGVVPSSVWHQVQALRSEQQVWNAVRFQCQVCVWTHVSLSLSLMMLRVDFFKLTKSAVAELSAWYCKGQSIRCTLSGDSLSAMPHRHCIADKHTDLEVHVTEIPLMHTEYS